MIQEFLTNNLIQVTEDENVNKLQKASNVLEKTLTKNKSKIQTYTLIALNPEISTKDSNVIEIQDLIIKYWKTFTSNCKDTPLTYIRAVILEALERLSADINLANIIWLSGRNIQKHFKLKGKEKELIIKFLAELGDKIELAASNKWSLSLKSNHDLKTKKLSSIEDFKLNTATLQKKLEDASGPHNSSGTPNYDAPNPHWSNASPNWSYEFPSRASRGISFVVNGALKNQTENINAVINGINEFFKEITVKTIEASQKQNQVLSLRSELLWWNKSCYSKTLKDSYRNKQNGLLQMILAIDYSSFVPVIFPQSVDYFLKETHQGIISRDDGKIKISEILKLIDSSKEILKEYLNEETFDEEGSSLFDFVKGLVFEKFSIKQFKRIVGISENTEITLSDFTLWLFHDLQIINSIKEGK